MPQCCVVPLCSSRVSGHRFPRDEQLRKKLIVAIRRDKYISTINSRVCNQHFIKSDYVMPLGSVVKIVKNREHTVNGDHSDAHQSTFSHSSKEGSPSKEVSTEDSPKKDKKKKKGLRTPSFLKKKKEKKKEKSSTPQPA